MIINFRNAASVRKMDARRGSAAVAARSFNIGEERYGVRSHLSCFLTRTAQVSAEQAVVLHDPDDPGSSRHASKLRDIVRFSSGQSHFSDFISRNGELEAIICSGILPETLTGAYSRYMRYPLSSGSLAIHDKCIASSGRSSELRANWAMVMHGSRNFGLQKSFQLLIANAFLINGVPFITGDVRNVDGPLSVGFSRFWFEDADIPCHKSHVWIKGYKICASGESRGPLNSFTADQVNIGGEPYYFVDHLFTSPVYMTFPQAGQQNPIPSYLDFSHVLIELPSPPENGLFRASGMEVTIGRGLADPENVGLKISIKGGVE